MQRPPKTTLLTLLLSSLLLSGCVGTSKKLTLHIQDSQGQPLPQAQIHSQLKHKRFLRPIIEDKPVLLKTNPQGRVKIPKVQAKGSAGWGLWALWIHAQAPGYEPSSHILAQFEHSSTTVKRQWEYPQGKNPTFTLQPLPTK